MCSAIRVAAFLTVLASVTLGQAGSPRLVRMVPPGGQRGKTLEVDFHGRFLEKPQEIVFYEQGITAESIQPLVGDIETQGRKEKVAAGTRVRVRLKLSDDCPLGPHGLRIQTTGGVTDYQTFFVGPFPMVDESDQYSKRNDQRETAQSVPLNSTIFGRMNDATDIDLYRIEVPRGQRISAELVAARIGVDRGIPDLYAAILDAGGKPLVEADDSSLFDQDPVVSTMASRGGTYFVQVRHSIYNANGETYLLHVGTFPRPTALYPAGGQAGSKLTVQVLGDPRGVWNTDVKLPADRSGDFPFVAVDSETGISAPSPNKLRVSPFANVLEAEPNNSPEAVASAVVVTLPAAFNGIIEKPGDVDCFHFRASKGDRFKVHALANAFGSPVDPTIWIKPLMGKSGGATLRATESRLNQLGIPPVGGLRRDTLDPVIEFAVPADGEYVLGVEDERGDGGSDFVYRVECRPETDAVFAYIPVDPENQTTPQVRQVVAVAAGNRYNTQVAIFNSNRPFDGDLELVSIGLPEGVRMMAPRLSPGMTRVPVVFEAMANVKPQAAFVDILVRPVGDTVPLDSGFRQVVAMNYFGNDFFLQTDVGKLLVAVTDAAPFTIAVEEPKSALVQNGEAVLNFAIQRAKGFDGPVTVNMEWRPNGVSGSTPVTVSPGKTEGEYLLGAAKNATAASYAVALTAYSGASRANNYDAADRTYVASRPFMLTVAEPHVEGRFVRTSIERGRTAQLVCKLNHLKPFTGKAQATLARLPRGVVLVEPTRQITSTDSQVEFTLRATDECLVGSYQGIVLDVTVVEGGQSLRQLSGYGMLRIDHERGAQARAK